MKIWIGEEYQDCDYWSWRNHQQRFWGYVYEHFVQFTSSLYIWNVPKGHSINFTYIVATIKTTIISTISTTITTFTTTIMIKVTFMSQNLISLGLFMTQKWTKTLPFLSSYHHEQKFLYHFLSISFQLIPRPLSVARLRLKRSPPFWNKNFKK